MHDLSLNSSSWFIRLAGSFDATVRLFAFPYSGGSAGSYAYWNPWLSRDIELYAAQLPGRAARMDEPALCDMDELIERMVPGIVTLLDKPFVFFGHSNGVNIAFALANRLLRDGLPSPSGLILSAMHPAGNQPSLRPSSQLSDREIIARLASFGGTPRELLDDPAIMDLALPAIRADFAVGERFTLPELHPALSNIRTLLLAGVDDEITPQEVFGFTQIFKDAETVCMEGGHFFIQTNQHFPDRLNGFCRGVLANAEPRQELLC